MGKRMLAFLYGSIAYVFFLATFLYAVGFVMDIAVPKSIDTGVETPFELALPINVALLALFGFQHSIMARPGFKRRWTRFVPKVVERSTFVLATNLVLCTLYWQWRPMPEVIWEIQGGFAVLLLALSWIGWGVVLLSTYLIDHFDLFGLKQVWYYLRGKPYPSIRFKERVFYRYTRHPLMLGFLVAFWSTPQMTLGHLVFAIVTTAYVLVAIQLEERDLLNEHGDSYRDYRRRVSMLVPFLGGRGRVTAAFGKRESPAVRRDARSRRTHASA